MMRYFLMMSTIVLLEMVGFAADEKNELKAGDIKTVDIGDGVKMDFVWCPPGEFMMGSPASEEGREDSETQHKVTLTRGFWLGKYEVTQGQWKAMFGGSSTSFEGSMNLPSKHMSWNKCQEFMKKLGERTGATYRLPSEAEWEYACRAGTTTAYYFGHDVSRLGEYAWYDENSGGRTHEVGGKKPNAWGLYDMLGNVWELCQDRRKDYGEYYREEPQGPVTDPQGASSGPVRMIRGGSWYVLPILSKYRSAFRYGLLVKYDDRDVAIGFRLVMNP